jgi:hypothetical protein
MWRELFCIISMDFDAIEDVPILSLIRIREQGGYNDTVQNLLIDFSTHYHLAWREVLYNTVAQFGILMRLVMLIK